MIHILPGMGADNRMYAGPWRELPDAQFHDWPGLETDSLSLKSVASRLIVDDCIQQGDSLIGSSLGGIIACEVAKQVSLNHLVLVGSARYPDEINQLLSIFHPLIDLAPISLIQRLSGKVPLDLAQSFEASDPHFIREMCKAVFRWDGFNDPFLKTYRIHGAHDLIISPPPNTDLLLPARHLVAVTHASECANFIQGISV